MRIESLGNVAVVGLQWGDEGKGKAVDVLMEHFDLVARYAGGANAGHTIVVNGEKFALHQIPSGIIRPGISCVLACGMVIDPAVLLTEIRNLEQRGISVAGRLWISNRSHLVFPYHRHEDAFAEKIAAPSAKIGTTSRGIGPCYADKVGRRNSIRVGDLLHPDRFRQRVADVVAYKNALFAALFDERTPLDPDAIVAEYLAFADQLKPFITDTTKLLHDAIDSGQRILFEGAQGAMLDLDHGTYPYVTSSNTGIGGIASGSGVPLRAVDSAIGIVKAYSTRVGEGPFPTEQHGVIGETIRQRGNEFGTTTGRPRRCGWFDAVAVGHAAQVGGPTHLAVAHLDTLSTVGELKIAVAYQCRGETLTHFPADAYELADVEPVYETLPGWDEPLNDCRRLSDLPPNARAYLDAIASHVGVPIAIVGVGPGREQTILTDES